MIGGFITPPIGSIDGSVITAVGELILFPTLLYAFRAIELGYKVKFSKERAEKYYRKYLEHFIDDKVAIDQLSATFENKKILILAPGKTLGDYESLVQKELQDENTISIALNFIAEKFKPKFIFSSNMRRFAKIQGKTDAKCIITSNMEEATQADYVVNFSSYAVNNPEIIDNSGLMLLHLLVACGVKEVKIAGMDGYSGYENNDYIDEKLEYDFSKQANLRNSLISSEICEIQKLVNIKFITPTYYR